MLTSQLFAGDDLLQRIEECGMQAHEVAYDSPFFQFLT